MFTVLERNIYTAGFEPISMALLPKLKSCRGMSFSETKAADYIQTTKFVYFCISVAVIKHCKIH